MQSFLLPPMKSKFLIIVLLLALFPSITSAQERGHMQYGVNLRGSGIMSLHAATDILTGWRFNEKRYLGIGTGMHYVEIGGDSDDIIRNGIVPAIPLYLDYRRYVQARRNPRHSRYFGIEGGGMVYVDELPTTDKYSTRIVPLIGVKLGHDYIIRNNFSIYYGWNFVISEASGIGLDLGLRF